METIFLDRDGVINANPPNNGYVCSWNDFTFLPNALEAIHTLTQCGYCIILTTNQAGIGKGIFTKEQLSDIHQRMLNEINKFGGHIEKIYYCPHHPDDGCPCRKPKPGMLLTAANEHCFDITSSFFIGDSLTDITAAKSAGAKPILVLTGHGRDSYEHFIKSEQNAQTSMPDKIFTNLFSASQWLKKITEHNHALNREHANK